MLLTHPSALKKPLFGDKDLNEWRFVILGFNNSWFHLTQITITNGQPDQRKTLIVSDASEIHKMTSIHDKRVRYEEAYLITPSHVNKSAASEQGLLRQIDRVVEYNDKHINIYHVYTIDHGKQFLSSAPLCDADQREVLTIYQAPQDVIQRFTERENAIQARKLEILQIAKALHGENTELALSWSLKHTLDLGGHCPFEMTSDEKFEVLTSYVSHLTLKRAE